MPKRRQGLLAGLWALSLAGLCASLTGGAGDASAVALSFSAAWVGLIAALSLGWRELGHIHHAFADAALWALAALLAGVVTLGASFAQVGTAELVTSQRGAALLYFAGRVPTYYMAARLLKAALMLAPCRRAWPTWACALIVLVCWLPYAFAIWPGTVSNDSITQLAEVVGTKALSNGNPVFQTGLIAAAVWLGKGLLGSADAAVAIYCVTQTLLLAWLLGYTAHRLSESRAPKWLAVGAMLFYALNPIFPVFAMCMGKDTTFAMAVLWLALMTARVLESKRPSPRVIVALCLSAALCALLRNVGAALAALTLVPLLAWAIRRQTPQRFVATGALAAVAVVLLTLYAVVLPNLGAEPTPEAENRSLQLQQVARVVASEPITDEQRAALNACLPVDELKSVYNGELSDPVKALWNSGATDEQKRAFFAAWAELLREHPATCLSATFHNSYGYLYPTYVSTIKPTLILGATGRTTLLDGAFDFSVNPRAEALKTTLAGLNAYPLWRLLTGPALYAWMALFACAALLKRGARKEWLIVAAPFVFTLIGCSFSAVNGYVRYAMPLYFAAPVLLCAAARGLAKGECQ